MKTDFTKLGELGMWETWVQRVRDSMPNFCANEIYVEQLSPGDDQFYEAMAKLKSRNWTLLDPEGRTRDAQFGGIVRKIHRHGEMTRMWADAQMEINFLSRFLPLRHARVLEIGGGYGRLAVILATLVHQYVCVDAVPMTTDLCKLYCSKFRPEVIVPTLAEFAQMAPTLEPTLAINVHSFNECTLEQIERWLDLLVEMKVGHLFTVSHGRADGHEPPYRIWDGSGGDFRPLIEARFALVAEEANPIGNHPQALWVIK